MREPLLRLEKRVRGGGSDPPDQEIAKKARIPLPTYRAYKAPRPENRASPSVRHAARLARYHDVPFDTLLIDEQPELFFEENASVRFKLQADARGETDEALRMAALGVLRGKPASEIANDIRRLPRFAGAALDAAELGWRTSGGLATGLVELAGPEHGSQLEDPELARRLAEALPPVSPDGRRAEVRVVRNLAHAGDFPVDPAAPFLIARVAHQVVFDFLTAQRQAYTVGIAGGAQVSAFVDSVGPTSSPFPDPAGSDRRFTLVPLTLEPFHEHGFGLADSLVGGLAHRVGSLLGPRRVTAPAFRPFGFLVNGILGSLQTDPLALVRRHYPELDAAIFGCGAQGESGWIERTLQDLGLELEPEPATDVCLNMLARDGTPVPLPSELGRCEFLGVRLLDVRRLVRNRNKLALLLTSGPRKGLPLTVVARAGCASSIVCDQAAARSALEVLRGG
jgi:hypothetical protein